MVGDFWREDFGLHAGHRRGAGADGFGALLEFLQLSRVIFLEIELERRQHADDLFLVDLHPAADRVAVRRGVEASAGDENLASEEETRALRPADALAAGKRDQ